MGPPKFEKQVFHSVKLKTVDMLKVASLVGGFIMGSLTTVWTGMVFHIETAFSNRTGMTPRLGAMMEMEKMFAHQGVSSGML